MHIHRVKENETVYDVAREYAVSPIKLACDNEIESMHRMAVGRELLVLMPTRTYNVKTGDTLEKIALRFETTKGRIKAQNPELSTSERLYPGQLLVIKSTEPRYGMGIANGYFYVGCKTEALIRAMPYLSYVTVCAAIAEEGKIRMIGGGEIALTESKKYNKIPLLRIYVKDTTDILSSDFIDSATLLAKSTGYDGITLSGKPSESDKEAIIELKRKMIDRELLLFIEKDLTNTECAYEYADATVLTYDKLHLMNIPSFADGEKYYMTQYAERCNPEGAFIELSAFSMIADKYVEKATANHIADKTRMQIKYDEERMLLFGKTGRGKRTREFRAESLENTKAKLELISELGYLGISFDIMRTPLAELLMFADMYTQPPELKRSVCNPRD